MQEHEEVRDVDVPSGFGFPGVPDGISTEQLRARQIVELAMYVPGWAIGAVVRKVQQELRRDRRSQRALILEPNRDSELKIERYTFGVNSVIEALGTEQVVQGSNSPDVNFRPQRVTTNIEHPAMVFITDGRVANVSFTVGGYIDAWMWGPQAVGQELDVPTITPANRAAFNGKYTGRVPKALADLEGKKYEFVLAFTGPASIVA